MMTKLELSTNELLMLKEMIKNDIENTGWDGVAYNDVALMQYYLDRAKVLVKVQEELET